MKKTTVYISDRHDQYLRKLGKILDIKPAELLRRALDEYITRNPLKENDSN